MWSESSSYLILFHSRPIRQHGIQVNVQPSSWAWSFTIKPASRGTIKLVTHTGFSEHLFWQHHSGSSRFEPRTYFASHEATTSAMIP
jgi:hypothetical protein